MALIDDLLAATEQRQQEREQEREVSPPNLGGVFGPFDPRDVNDEDIHPDLLNQQIQVPASRRRGRSDSLTPDERRAKYARFTELACDNNHLAGTYRRQVQDFVVLSPVEQSIAIYALLQRNQSEFVQSKSESLLLSSGHKDTTAPLLSCLFFAPTLRSYVTSIDQFLKDDTLTHGSDWGLSDSLREDTKSRKNIINGYSRSLTTLRNKAKTALSEAYENGWCIKRLLKKLMHEDLYMSEEHRSRWAWIAGYYKECRESGDASRLGYNFWGKVDEELTELEKMFAEKAREKTPQGRAEFRHDFFASALKAHQTAHPTTEAPRSVVVHAPFWQASLEARIARSFSFD